MAHIPAALQVIRHHHNGKSKGYGFVSFGDQIEGARVMKEMQGKYIGELAGPAGSGCSVMLIGCLVVVGDQIAGRRVMKEMQGTYIGWLLVALALLVEQQACYGFAPRAAAKLRGCAGAVCSGGWQGTCRCRTSVSAAHTPDCHASQQTTIPHPTQLINQTTQPSPTQPSRQPPGAAQAQHA